MREEVRALVKELKNSSVSHPERYSYEKCKIDGRVADQRSSDQRNFSHEIESME